MNQNPPCVYQTIAQVGFKLQIIFSNVNYFKVQTVISLYPQRRTVSGVRRRSPKYLQPPQRLPYPKWSDSSWTATATRMPLSPQNLPHHPPKRPPTNHRLRLGRVPSRAEKRRRPRQLPRHRLLHHSPRFACFEAIASIEPDLLHHSHLCPHHVPVLD